MIEFHARQVAKLTAELETMTDEIEIEAIEWALAKHWAALRNAGIFAL